MSSPTLIVVSGPPGSGKTTLAHCVAKAIGCPAVCRDEIKEGMALSTADFRPYPDDPLTGRTFEVFFQVVRLLLEADVTVVAEAAFQGFRWDPELEKLAVLSRIKTIRCHVDARTAGKRAAARNASSSVRRLAHATPETPFNADDWKGITLRLPILTVDTTDGYIPGLDAIVSYALDHSECDRTHSSRRQGSP